MRKFVVVTLLSLTLGAPAFGKTHSDIFPIPCSELWPAVKDTIRNSGKYGIIAVDSSEMTASFNIGGSLGGKRINSVVLNAKGASCEMQIQTAFSGLAHNDAGDFKKRVGQSLAKLKESKPASETAAAPAAPGATPVPPQPSAEPAVPASVDSENLATVVIKSNPDGADVTVDGKYMGSTPSTVRLAPGDHVIALEKSGFKTWQRTMAVSPGGIGSIDATLEKNP